jgi:hypothetical protein
MATFFAPGYGAPDSADICAGCGATAPNRQKIVNNEIVNFSTYDYVGVGSPDLEAQTTPEGEEGLDPADMVAYPVCDACFTNPTHRTTPLKVHFFPREAVKIAVLTARAQILRA